MLLRMPPSHVPDTSTSGIVRTPPATEKLLNPTCPKSWPSGLWQYHVDGDLGDVQLTDSELKSSEKVNVYCVMSSGLGCTPSTLPHGEAADISPSNSIKLKIVSFISSSAPC